MVEVRYELDCRSCLTTEEFPQITTITDIGASELMRKTEFEVAEFLENSRREIGRRCSYCGAFNLEVVDLTVEGHPLYNFDSLIQRCRENFQYMITFNIDKRGGDLRFTRGGNQQIEIPFLKAAISQVNELLISRRQDQFDANDMGNFFICFTCDYNMIDSKNIELQIERFRSTGLTEREIKSTLNSFAKQHGVKKWFWQ